MEIIKGGRHSKIIGDFGENLICNWLSRSGFEVVIVDYVGIDIVAILPRQSSELALLSSRAPVRKVKRMTP